MTDNYNMYAQACSMNYKQMDNTEIIPPTPIPDTSPAIGTPVLVSPKALASVIGDSPFMTCTNVTGQAATITRQASEYFAPYTIFLYPVKSISASIYNYTKEFTYIFTANADNIRVQMGYLSYRDLMVDGVTVQSLIKAGKTYMLNVKLVWTTTSYSTTCTLTEYDEPIAFKAIEKE